MGRRVLAPFGPKTLLGYVVGTQQDTPNFPTKPIQSWVDEQPLLDEHHLQLAQWLSQTYLCSVGEALAAILPAPLRPPKRTPVPSSLVGGPAIASVAGGEGFTLTDEQQAALAPFLHAVDSQSFHPFLLRGITDSGKTELYLRTIDHVLKQGRQAIFLLPEIALTPPFIDRLKGRYSAERVGVWHSGISAGERYRTWQRARQGEIQVILGARSAVFAPLPQLGVIVMDEEHEASYKQEDRPKYHTRDVALWRAEQAKAVLIMGSATPSLESYWNAKKGIYSLLELTSRVEMRQLPPVTLIDRRPKDKSEKITPAARRAASFDIFTEPMKLAIEQRLARKEQVMLFINRRGYVPFMRCSKCGWVARCERCTNTLSEHIKEGKHLLQCHACFKTYPMVIQCPACKSMRLSHFGVGTQKIEQEVKQLFPFVKLARLDRDVDQPRKTYEKVYRSFAARELDVLVGTQVIAKGFDFPGVTLVGIVDADISLHLPDFRAAERTFQLITQVAGRTGRGDQGGKVLVQTHHPEHYALQAAQQHDYLGFYEQELQHRQTLNYPPFCKLVHVLVRARKEDVAQSAADELADALIKTSPQVDVLGPALAPHGRLRSQYRYQIVLKGSAEALLPALDFLRAKRLSKAFLSVDVDPMDLL